jgi:AcrR family transcriptional regulator
MHAIFRFAMNVKDVRRRPRLSRAESQARTRERLLAAATDVFVSRGFVAATIEDIVGVAGYTRGAFYAHFTDKADAFLTVLETRRASQFGELASDLQVDDEGAILPTMAAWFAQRAADPLDRAAAEFRLVALDSPEHRARLESNMRALRDAVAAMAEGYCAGNGITLPIDYATFAVMIVSMVGGFFDQLRLVPDTPPDILALALTSLWNGLTTGETPSG